MQRRSHLCPTTRWLFVMNALIWRLPRKHTWSPTNRHLSAKTSEFSESFRTNFCPENFFFRSTKLEFFFSLFLEKLNECFYQAYQMKSELHELAYKIVCLRNPTTKDSISSPHQHQPPIDETIALSKPSLVSTLSSGNGRTGHGDSIRSLPNNGFIIGGGSCTSTSTTATLGRYFSGLWDAYLICWSLGTYSNSAFSISEFYDSYLGDDMVRRHGGFDETHTTEYEPDSILKGHNRNRLSRLV